jgi:hypothetical protein
MPTSSTRSPYNRLRWTVDDAREVLGDLGRSGKPIGVFATARGLDPQRLYSWRRRLGVVTTPTEFEEVVLRSSRAEGNDRERFEVVLCTGHVVRVPASFDPADLRRLLEVLEKAREC